MQLNFLLVAIDDVFRWSPAVWLVGVIICALLMNMSVQIRRFVQRIKENRLRERQNLLFSLNMSGSLTNLSPSQLHEQICWRHRQRFYSANVPPSYEQIGRCPLVSPPAFVVCANNNNNQRPQQQRHKEAPPKYKAIANEQNGSISSSEEDISPPSYDERIQGNGP
ncbi:hypothetical protein niasHT_037401 [Heterodera trifolii]|uniref:Uncharacterized protein n=1 Tax=Heterodera trifolii TaxID=157864 RepID=A0ABD2J548_9BILA